MIGQERLLDKINNWNEVPRFMIFSGFKGIGRKTLAKEIASKFNLELIFISNKIDDIRNMINVANEIDTGVIFYIENGDRMSTGASNTLLKITEEAPNNTHIILAVQNKELLLPTILSRGTTLMFMPNNNDDWKQYVSNLNYNGENYPFYEVYPSFGYVDILPLEKGLKLLEFSDKVIDSIRNANGANAFKISESIKLKDDGEGYELIQFMYCLLNRTCRKMVDALVNNNMIEYSYLLEFSKVIISINKELVNPLFNKAYILDKLIIKLKSIEV